MVAAIMHTVQDVLSGWDDRLAAELGVDTGASRPAVDLLAGVTSTHRSAQAARDAALAALDARVAAERDAVHAELAATTPFIAGGVRASAAAPLPAPLDAAAGAALDAAFLADVAAFDEAARASALDRHSVSTGAHPRGAMDLEAGLDALGFDLDALLDKANRGHLAGMATESTGIDPNTNPDLSGVDAGINASEGVVAVEPALREMLEAVVTTSDSSPFATTWRAASSNGIGCFSGGTSESGGGGSDVGATCQVASRGDRGAVVASKSRAPTGAMVGAAAGGKAGGKLMDVSGVWRESDADARAAAAFKARRAAYTAGARTVVLDLRGGGRAAEPSNEASAPASTLLSPVLAASASPARSGRARSRSSRFELRGDNDNDEGSSGDDGVAPRAARRVALQQAQPAVAAAQAIQPKGNAAADLKGIAAPADVSSHPLAHLTERYVSAAERLGALMPPAAKAAATKREAAEAPRGGEAIVRTRAEAAVARHAPRESVMAPPSPAVRAGATAPQPPRPGSAAATAAVRAAAERAAERPGSARADLLRERTKREAEEMSALLWAIK